MILTSNPFEAFDSFLKKPATETPDNAEWITWHEWRMRSLEKDGAMGKAYFRKCRDAHDARILKEEKPKPVEVVKTGRKKLRPEGPSLMGLEE